MKIIIASSKSWFKLDKKLKKNNKIKFLSSNKELKLKTIKKFSPDYIFFPHWSWRVSKNIYKNFNCILFHTAPLPYGRGGSPIQNLIIKGIKSAPVCALKMDESIDSGDIYLKKNINLNGNLTEIFDNINNAVNFLISRIIKKNLKAYTQKGKAVYFKRLNTEDNEIKGKLNITQIYDRIRMVDHFEYPKAFINLCNYKVEFSNAKLNSNSLSFKANILFNKKNKC